MQSQPESTKVHFEMASVSEKILLMKMMKFIVPYANSLGMNEQVSTFFVLNAIDFSVGSLIKKVL